MKGDGTGSFSIYGDKFPVRPAQWLRYYANGIYRMKTFRKSTQALVYYLWCVSYTPGVASHLNPCKKANSGANTNGCQVCTVLPLERDLH